MVTGGADHHPELLTNGCLDTSRSRPSERSGGEISLKILTKSKAKETFNIFKRNFLSS